MKQFIKEIMAKLNFVIRATHLNNLYFFCPSSKGNRIQLGALTESEIQQFPNAMINLMNKFQNNKVDIKTTQKYLSEKHPNFIEGELAKTLKVFGSDKSTRHSYYKIYEAHLKKNEIKAILEVGLGTNNINVPSNMGKSGKPGASLRAFAEHLDPTCVIHGLDVDKTILFTEKNIETFYVDQHDPQTFYNLEQLKKNYNLIIDDGLHAPAANVNTLSFFINRLSHEGMYVIEDVPERTVSFWQSMLGAILSEQFEATIVQDKVSYLVIISKS